MKSITLSAVLFLVLYHNILLFTSLSHSLDKFIEISIVLVLKIVSDPFSYISFTIVRCFVCKPPNWNWSLKMAHDVVRTDSNLHQVEYLEALSRRTHSSIKPIYSVHWFISTTDFRCGCSEMGKNCRICLFASNKSRLSPPMETKHIFLANIHISDIEMILTVCYFVYFETCDSDIWRMLFILFSPIVALLLIFFHYLF